MVIVKKQKKQPNNNKETKGLKSSQLELTRHAGVSFGSSELLLSHVLIGDRFDDVRSSNEQIRRVLFTNIHNNSQLYTLTAIDYI